MAITAAARNKTKTAKEINNIEESQQRNREEERRYDNESIYGVGKEGKGKARQKGHQKGQPETIGKGKGQKEQHHIHVSHAARQDT